MRKPQVPNDVADLETVLNWTAEEVEAAAAAIADDNANVRQLFSQVLDNALEAGIDPELVGPLLGHTRIPEEFENPEVVGTIIELLRELPHRPHEWPCITLVRGEEVLLLVLANWHPCSYYLDGTGGGTVPRIEDGHGPGATSLRLLAGATRGLWPVLMEDAKILRCEAPLPGHTGSAGKCGRWFVSGGTVGRPRKYCSDACAQRQAKRMMGTRRAAGG